MYKTKKYSALLIGIIFGTLNFDQSFISYINSTLKNFIKPLSKYIHAWGILFMLFLTFGILSKNLTAQGSNQQKVENDTLNTIVWVSQFPEKGNYQLKKSFMEKLLNFITGNENTELISKPMAVWASNPDNFWVLDQGNGTLIKSERKVGEITQLKNTKNTRFPSVVGICEISENNYLITDSFLNTLFLFRSNKRELLELNDSLHLEQPTGVAYSVATNEIWVVETKAHQISILDSTGNFIRKIGQRGTGNGEFNFPTSIWIDKSGTVFIVDAMNFRIQIFSKNGEFISTFGEIGDATGYMARPKGIATDSDGNIYVVDALFNAVQIFDQEGRFLYSFGVQGQGDGEFWMPTGIYVDEYNYIYVADTYNSRVQIFQLRKGSKE